MQGKADEVQFIVAVLMQLNAKKKAADSSLIERPAWVHALKCEFDAMVVQFKTGLYLQNRGPLPSCQRLVLFPCLSRHLFQVTLSSVQRLQRNGTGEATPLHSSLG